MFFQTHKGSLQVFRYCSIFKVLCASALRLTTYLFYHRSGFLSSFIFSRLLNVLNLERFVFLGANRELVGVRPLHLAFARPLCLLERPTGAIHCFRNRKTFQRLLVLFKGFLLWLRKSFFCLSAWRSSIIPHPRLLVNTF